MSDYITQRYVGMGSYDLQRYYDLLLIMREYYRADNSSAKGSLNVILVSVILVLFVLLFGWSILNNEWFVLLTVLGLAIATFWIMIKKGDKDSDFEAGFITKVMNSGFTRADATEFLYDLDWDDIQYEESRVEYILKDIKELENAKNK